MNCKNRTHCIARIFALLASVVLLAALSVEVITGDNIHFPQWFMCVQLAVCIVFIAAFFVEMSADDNPKKFFCRHLLFLLLSVPYLNIIHWCGVQMNRHCMMVLVMITLLRAFLAMYLVVRWLVGGGSARQLFFAYLFTVVVFTYLSGIVFYDFEIHVNPNLHTLGDAMWWAGMGVTTVGAAIFPVTAVGKIFAVLLPLLGMLMLPVFTVYVTDRYKKG